MDDTELLDSDWAPLREAIPAYAETWAGVTADSSYDPTLAYGNLGDMARWVAREMLVQRPDELPAIGVALEYLYGKAAVLPE
jgi:hypothetical protein